MACNVACYTAINGTGSATKHDSNCSVYSKTTSQNDLTHQAISSYFIGPQAENLPYFEKNIKNILHELKETRHSYHKEDGIFISKEIQNSKKFKETTERVEKAIQMTARLLGKHSIPFWSPRYQGHMCMDMGMPGLLGYFMTMLYNPNNVALEASPLTTLAELDAGKQLCRLFGYNVDPEDHSLPLSWGHVTCDGTVANLESIWVARNLKFYPLALRNAMAKGEPLSFIDNSFKVHNCVGEEKPFRELENWELLNLKPKTVLDLPDRLNKEYGVSAKFMEKVMKKHSIQSTGKEVLERQYGVTLPCQYMLSTTRHYSWPKGGAIAGIGDKNIVGIPVDNAARVDIKKLEERLELNLKNKQAVYAVVAIIGSTEEGAVDPLTQILALRKKFQAKGLSFLVHADAAWGGYFCSMLPRNYHPGDIINIPTELGPKKGFVPDMALRTDTQEELFALRYADSITVDPHKAGYIPYPAGGLCYRDERMRYLVTWTSPYLSRGSTTSVGIFGVEGSKPGASAMSTWLSNACIGLDSEGYGALLGEVTFTCSRLSAEWAAMTTSDMNWKVVPFNMLPSELEENSTDAKVDAEKRRIRAEILNKTNSDLIEEDAQRPEDQKTMKLLRALGSDLNINAFALNFKRDDGKWNEDIEEANYLNQRVIERFSVDSPDDDPTEIELYLSSTEFSHELYGSCAENFKKRLGLRADDGGQALFVLRNVVMSPWPTDGDFINTLANKFKEVVTEEAEICRKRNSIQRDYHSFLMQGTENIYLVHCPMFHKATHRRQLILSVDIGDKEKEYLDLKKGNPKEALTLVSHEKICLDETLDEHMSFRGDITTAESGKVLTDITVSIRRVIKDRPLELKYRDDDYPSSCAPFYLYGGKNDCHIDHILSKAPNIQLSAENVSLEVGDALTDKHLNEGVIMYVTRVHEGSMHPFPPTKELENNPAFFFRAKNRLDVVVYHDTKKARESGPGLSNVNADGKIASGTMTLDSTIYIDSDNINKDPFKKVDKVHKWKKEFSKIGRELGEEFSLV